MLQQSFLHIFGVAQNFQLNGEGFMAQKGGGGDRPPLATALARVFLFILEIFLASLGSVSVCLPFLSQTKMAITQPILKLGPPDFAW